ncbi:putative kinesin [Trypanosoma rangeli]|uniref:Putative kinesin n=1 Tax=Trypanosoma rangeli TaxID=5698 RepID=A0A422NN66_TRYRA|nr:putative kinesin [Trypanosoma rangeli]RNF06819.1 putative kinesin [Trypanosoma rangeli]|eukprot:RNF06819.1 putative kinesin [Trypanosoma rangeli]
MISATEKTRDDALKKATEGLQLLQSADRLVEGTSSLYGERTDMQWAIFSSAMDCLQTACLAYAAETQQRQEDKLSSLRREHEVAVSVLEKKVCIAKAVLKRWSEDEVREAAAVRAFNALHLSSVIKQTCALAADHVSKRQDVALQEELARVEMTVSRRELEMQLLHREEMVHGLIEGHAAFAAHCAVEHAALVEIVREGLASLTDVTQRFMEQWQEQRSLDCLRLEENMRGVLNFWEAGESSTLHGLGSGLLLCAFEIDVIGREVESATKLVLFENHVLVEQDLPLSVNPVVMLMFLEQYKQCAFEELMLHYASLDDARRACSVEVATEALRYEYEVTITALEEHFYHEMHALQKENAELKVNLSNLRDNLEFRVNLDQLEEEIVLRNVQQDTQQRTDGLYFGSQSGNDKVNATKHGRTNAGLGGYLSSFFLRSRAAGSDASPPSVKIMGDPLYNENFDVRGAVSSGRTPAPTARQALRSIHPSHPSLVASSASRVNHVPLSRGKVGHADDSLCDTEDSQR